MEKARAILAEVGTLAKTQQEGLQYADLHGYLLAVDDYHKQFERQSSADLSRNSGQKLIRYRDRLKKTFE